MLGEESPQEFNKEQETAIETGMEDNSLSTNGEETWDSVFFNAIKWCTTIGLMWIAVIIIISPQ